MEVLIDLDASEDGPPRLRRAATVRTARRLFEGHVLCPAAAWPARFVSELASPREETT
jgi:2-methylaconitate cis-trans-isomerase PrpF